MKLKIALATATALGLCMGGAWADSNESYISQSGDNNNSIVDQTADGENVIGTSAAPALQNGDYNDANITQSNGSTLGVPATYTDGVDQMDDYNVLSVDQKNGRIQEVQQTGADGATGVTNTLTINQTDNVASTSYATGQVGSVIQTYTGTSGGADRNSVIIGQALDNAIASPNHFNNVKKVIQNGDQNSVSIDQVSGWNTISTVMQSNGSRNVATITQGSAAGGHHNFTNTVSQAGSDNLAVLHLNGSDNGGALINPGKDAAGNHSAALVQTGDFNQASLTVDGDRNAYAIKQQGDRNIATGLSISGDDNGIGIGQYFGDDNIVTLTDISGDQNQVGLRQDGDRNDITGLGFGSYGTVAILQGGDDNVATFEQIGDSNVIGVDIDGDRNHLNMTQNNTGATGNSISVDISGDDNNNYPNSPGFSDDARAARDVVRTHLGTSTFGQGSLLQEGSSNSLTVTVVASSNANAFAMFQEGANNTIGHSISSGGANQAVVSQIGSDNMSDTSQTGNNNNIGITQ